MDQYYIPLYEIIKTYIHQQDTLDLIYQAFLFASEKHKGQKRASGEEYIVHPVGVAKILASFNADPVSLISALLHDTIEDTNTSSEEIKSLFGVEVEGLVLGLTKIEAFHYTETKENEDEMYASNFQKMLFQMSKDIRVIWVKLADRLFNMQTLYALPYEKQIRISKETMAIYAPIAHKLGMYQIKAELEDLCFKYLYPAEYINITKKLKTTKKSRTDSIDIMKSELKELMDKEGVSCEIEGRIKNLYSIYNKMIRKNIEFENIYDLSALRIIVNSIMDCYKVLGIVHSKYVPLPSRFKDYIAMPKPNMYQSLHTTVTNNGRIFEIQIRTHEMDMIAEYGIAAHWAYKEGTKLNENYYESTASKLRWYGDLLNYTKSNSDTSRDDVTTVFDEDVLQANVYVFTPKNQVISLPEGATPIDFAYRIHSRVGDSFTGAIVNGKIVPIDYQFKTGDICEIRTSKSAFGPNENWLKIAKTSGARSKIKNFLTKKNRDSYIERGKEILEEQLKIEHLDFELTDDIVKEKIQIKDAQTCEDIYMLLAKDVITPQSVIMQLKGDDRNSNERIIDMINVRNKNQVLHDDIDIVVEGLDSPSVKLSKCCTPIPGDEIIGYITKGVGIAIHTKDCKNVQSFEEGRLIPVHWSSLINRRFQVDLKMLTQNRDNILADVINSSTSSNAKVVKVSAKTNEVGEAIINLSVQVYNLNELNTLIANLVKIKGVFSIERISH